MNRRQAVALLIAAAIFSAPLLQRYLTINASAQGGANVVSITALGTPVTEDFNTLATTGTSSTLPTG